jgi:hypothetical protein
VTEVWEGDGRQSRWNKGIISPLCRKVEEMDCTDFLGLLYILPFTEPSPVLDNRHWVYVEIQTEKYQRSLH